MNRRILFAAILAAATWLLLLTPAWASVGITGFQARAVPAGIQIDWVTGFEDNNLGFNIWRATNDNPTNAVIINALLIPTASSGGSGATYTYLDSGVVAGVTYFYWLQDVDGSNPGDDPTDFEGPVSASFGTSGGLNTPTPPAPGNEPSPTPRPTTTLPTPTATPLPGSTATPTAAVRTATPTAQATIAGGSTPPATMAADEVPAVQTASTNAADGNSQSATEDPQPAATAPSGSGPELASTGQDAAVVQEDGGADPNAAAAIAAAADSAARGVAPNAGVIGGGAASGTVLTGQAAESGVSPLAIMLILAGGVFLLGGGATALVLWRRKPSTPL